LGVARDGPEQLGVASIGGARGPVLPDPAGPVAVVRWRVTRATWTGKVASARAGRSHLSL
jgi:hypothetical protein